MRIVGAGTKALGTAVEVGVGLLPSLVEQAGKSKVSRRRM